MQTNISKPICIWLWTCSAMVLALIVIGATTRLTGSGLSMVEWRPIMGVLPPMHKQEWLRIFHLYQQTSQYHLLTFGMELEEFRAIFWWEYIHRLFARLIGIIYAIPMIIFWLGKQLPTFIKPYLILALLLGSLQAIIGWWMVKSGLTDRIEVAPIRLAIHLVMGILIFALLFFLAILTSNVDIMALQAQKNLKQSSKIFQLGNILIGCFFILIIITITSGALVAGSKAGFAFNDWPWMHGRFLPPIYWQDHQNGGINFEVLLFENRGSIQFHHRMLAYASCLFSMLAIWHAYTTSNASIKISSIILATLIVMQTFLGIITLLYTVPLPLALLHQFGACLVVMGVVWHTMMLYKAAINHSVSISR